MLIIIIISLFVISSLVVFFSFSGNITQQNKQSTLLTDLGLKNRWWGGKTTPFYRWSWRKISKERVWGERIVKEAFKKSQIWLTLDDITFFEQKCEEYQKTRKANDSQIMSRVEQIVKRTEEMENTIRQQVREMIHRIVSTSDSEANRFLQESGINLEGKDRILQRYGSILIRRLADRVGYSMLGHHSGGEESKALSQVQGIEGWERWLVIYKQMITSECMKCSTSSNQSILESILSIIRSGLLKDYEQDVVSYRHFMETMDKQLNDKHFPIKLNRLEELECILYTWQFDNDIRFNNADHTHIRQFLSRTDLSPRFRRYALEGIQPHFESIHSLIHSVPRHVVFYGSNGFARAYAADQYHLHLERFMEIFARLARMEVGSPGIVTFVEEEIDKRRKEIAANTRSMVLQGKGMNIVETTRQSIEEIFLHKKERSVEKRNIEEEIADKRGWLIDFPWDEQNVEVFGLFRNEPFKFYQPINCDAVNNIDFLSNNSNAKRQRTQFFEIILDSLLKNSPFLSFAENP